MHAYLLCVQYLSAKPNYFIKVISELLYIILVNTKILNFIVVLNAVFLSVLNREIHENSDSRRWLCRY